MALTLLHLPLPPQFYGLPHMAMAMAKGRTTEVAPKVSDHRVVQPFTSQFMMHSRIRQLPSCGFNSLRQMNIKVSRQTEDAIIMRRSANYHPSIWKDEYIQSLNTEFKGETYKRQLNQLKKEARTLLGERTRDSLENLKLIDTLQRLGISYHFESEIKNILERTYQTSYEEDGWKRNDLYATSLEFRLLRQHGYDISQEVFNGFRDEMGNFKPCFCEDINGMLSLYEASFLSIKGENVLEEAKYFTIKYLKKYIISSKDELKVAIVRHALELPLHWRVPRLEARWSIDIYERRVDIYPILLETAKLDFNLVQSIYQEDLKYASSWWKSTRLGEKLSFARDELVENFLWTIGIGFEPELQYFRRTGTKIVALITMIDDVYDVYGTLDELTLFTNAIERWDITALEQLPEYMKECFFALYNSINEIASKALRDHGVNVMQYLKKVWVDLCKSYLLEANWYHSGYKPTLQEYMNNAWVSVAGPIMLVHSYIFMTSHMVKDELESLTKYEDIIRWSSTIMRLANDLLIPVDAQNIGDVSKSIQCYVNETGVSKNNAREYMRYLIDESWKKLNEVQDEKLVFSQAFVKMSKNLARMAQCMYQYGDGHSIDHDKTNDHVVSLIVQPINIH